MISFGPDQELRVMEWPSKEVFSEALWIGRPFLDNKGRKIGTITEARLVGGWVSVTIKLESENLVAEE